MMQQLQGPGWRAQHREGYDHFILTVWLDPTTEGEYPGHSNRPYVTRFVEAPEFRLHKQHIINTMREFATVFTGGEF
jgi:hypothetical protein